MEEIEFEDRYFPIKASLLQCLEKLKPPSQASRSNSETSDNTLTQILEQQAALLQLSQHANDVGSNEALTRILEQQGTGTNERAT